MNKDKTLGQAASTIRLEDKGQLTTSELVAMAWDDGTSFDHIKSQSGLSEAEIVKIMRIHMRPSSFRMWRKRVSGRASKHGAKTDITL